MNAGHLFIIHTDFGPPYWAYFSCSELIRLNATWTMIHEKVLPHLIIMIICILFYLTALADCGNETSYYIILLLSLLSSCRGDNTDNADLKKRDNRCICVSQHPAFDTVAGSARLQDHDEALMLISVITLMGCFPHWYHHDVLHSLGCGQVMFYVSCTAFVSYGY